MFGMLGVLSAFLTYDIFSLQWVYWDVNPLQVEKDLNINICIFIWIDIFLLPRWNHAWFTYYIIILSDQKELPFSVLIAAL